MPIDAQTAERFYGTAAPAASPQPPQSTIATSEPAVVTPDQKESAADTLYGSAETATSTYAPELRGQVEVLAAHLGVGPQERQAMEREQSTIFADARIPSNEAVELHTMFVQHVKAPADDATRNAWAADTLTQLHERYGDSADTRLATAKQWIAERPELSQLLASTGLGNHPKVVLALVSRSHELRFRSKK